MQWCKAADLPVAAIKEQKPERNLQTATLGYPSGVQFPRRVKETQRGFACDKEVAQLHLLEQVLNSPDSGGIHLELLPV